MMGRLVESDGLCHWIWHINIFSDSQFHVIHDLFIRLISLDCLFHMIFGGRILPNRFGDRIRLLDGGVILVGDDDGVDVVVAGDHVVVAAGPVLVDFGLVVVTVHLER